MSVTIALFTRDLRVHDNPVLSAAHQAGSAVVPLFVLDKKILGSTFNAPNRAKFLAESLASLDKELRAIGGRLVIRHGNVVDEVARLVEELDATQVHVASDVSRFSHRRDEALRERLRERGCDVHTHTAVHTVVEPGDVLPSGDRDHFAVFTPYLRRWESAQKRRTLGKPRTLRLPDVRGEDLPKQADICKGDTSPNLAEGGETVARKLLTRWLAGPIEQYHEIHDDLAGDATSKLSPYLHFGCLSATEVVDRTNGATTGGAAFIRQMAWRDFHHQVLAARPDAATADYRDRHDKWRDDAKAADAWREGRTGFPIVDAGMRQLADEGWMHNRARMITASFLTKSMYIDWRVGAQHFNDLLIDADMANNIMNWQWVAGTGTDTRPNRVLSPMRQAERFDADGEYVRRWVPELRDIPGGLIHKPWDAWEDTHGYPSRIVDHAEGAAHFQAMRNG